jgi:hypothetical protein
LHLANKYLLLSCLQWWQNPYPLAASYSSSDNFFVNELGDNFKGECLGFELIAAIDLPACLTTKVSFLFALFPNVLFLLASLLLLFE